MSSKELHSAIRWEKMDEARDIMEKFPEVVNIKDPQNFNTAIHIAAQNGHAELCQLIINCKGDVNCQNGGGQTALHMALSYDNAEVVELLQKAGADGSIINADGHPAKWGLTGEKNPNCAEFKLQALKEATTTFMFMAAFDALLKCADVETAQVCKVALPLKRAYKSEWTSAVQAKLGEFISR